ncbi:ABC transporter substrate-binding protein [Methylobacterium sp. WSM2598]|uniref:ABC transporter substrate-binding protein n=1 Tax=Methylobacterium sp. WSM2598 TaxID=398261 RepID=UPI0012F6D476|nr:ABC transporter substrate-binding protein [Methylobacterium sp. WSM2598]
MTGSVASHGHYVRTFQKGLRDLGYSDGRDFALQSRWSDGRLERLPALTDELAKLDLDVAVTATVVAARACTEAMPSIPVVSATLVDPIGSGLARSLARPGGNVTGITLVSFGTLLGKQVEFARELIPGAATVGILVNTRNSASRFQKNGAEEAASSLRIELKSVEVGVPEDIGSAMNILTDQRCDFVLIPTDAMFITERHRVAAAASAARMPIVSGFRELIEVGGLLSYGTDINENWRRASYFVDRILKGATPADLPIEQPTRYELALNLRTAHTLGLKVNTTLIALADQVIE